MNRSDLEVFRGLEFVGGFVFALVWILMRGRRTLLLLENRFNGLRRVGIAVALLACSMGQLLLVAVVIRYFIPFVVTVLIFGWLAGFWLGCSLLLWMIFGGLNRIGGQSTSTDHRD